MDTTIKNGLVEPRSYQLYGDDIESKQAVEPISIVSGTGPICGFNHLYYYGNDATSMVISGTGSTSRYGGGELEVITPHKHVVISNKSNEAGRVVNAYTTPDGLVHIAPDYIMINNSPVGGWPALDIDPYRAVVFALKAKHTYTDQEVESDVPSDINFEVTWISDIAKSNLDLIKVLKGNYNDLLESLPDGWLNTNTETLIGLYIVGWDLNWEYGDNSEVIKDFYKPIFKSLNYKLGLIPYNGTWPVSSIGNGPLEYLANELKLNHLKENITKYIKEGSITNPMIADKAIDINKLSDDTEFFRDYYQGSLALTIKPKDSGEDIQVNQRHRFGLNVEESSWYQENGPYAEGPCLYLKLVGSNTNLLTGSIQIGMNYSTGTSNVTGATIESVSKVSKVFYTHTFQPAILDEINNTVAEPERDILEIFIYGVDTGFSSEGYTSEVKLYLTSQFKR